MVVACGKGRAAWIQADDPSRGRVRERRRGGLEVEDAKGECNFGQHEINFRFDRALATADGHVIYKNGAKEIAAQEGCSITFMPKFNEREGNSCHVHLSLRGHDGTPVFAADGHGFSPTFESFLAGQLACLRELTMFLAPNINSYKRYAVGSFAPTAVAWGKDNRTCSLRGVDRAGPEKRGDHQAVCHRQGRPQVDRGL
jgi:glutamine synthetase